jgi:hypothetical protein
VWVESVLIEPLGQQGRVLVAPTYERVGDLIVSDVLVDPIGRQRKVVHQAFVPRLRNDLFDSPAPAVCV